MNEAQNLNEDQISSETKITNEPKILKEHQISKEIQITRKPQILKDCQISKIDKLQMNPEFKKKQISKKTQIMNPTFGVLFNFHKEHKFQKNTKISKKPKL